MPQWPDEVIAAVNALEDKYDIELVSGPHHAEWVERHDRLREALKGLVDRLDVIHEDPAFRSVWAVNQMHVGPYTGPTYVKELAAARQALG